jgi:hypothetical protein
MIGKMLEENDLKYQLMAKDQIILKLENENIELRNKIMLLSQKMEIELQ